MKNVAQTARKKITTDSSLFLVGIFLDFRVDTVKFWVGALMIRNLKRKANVLR